MKRISAVFAAVLMAAVFCLTPVGALADGEEPREKPDMTDCQAAMVYDATTDTVLFEYNPDERIQPASVTKIMTAIMLMEYDPELRSRVTYTQEIANIAYAVKAYPLKVGETVSTYDCLGYMIAFSANEAACTLGVYVGEGSMQNFVDKMNARLKELGCYDTNFIDAQGAGLYHHYTTCRDIIKLAQYAMSFDAYRDCASITYDAMPPTAQNPQGLTYEATNRLISPRGEELYPSEYREYFKGVKTGSYRYSGKHFVGCMEYNGHTYYTAVLGSDDLIGEDGLERLGCLTITLDLVDYAVKCTEAGYTPECATTSFIYDRAAGEAPFVAIDGKYAAVAVSDGVPELVYENAQGTVPDGVVSEGTPNSGAGTIGTGTGTGTGTGGGAAAGAVAPLSDDAVPTAARSGGGVKLALIAVGVVVLGALSGIVICLVKNRKDRLNEATA